LYTIRIYTFTCPGTPPDHFTFRIVIFDAQGHEEKNPQKSTEIHPNVKISSKPKKTKTVIYHE